MTELIPVRLNSLYLNKKLESETFIKLLGDNNPPVIFRMYYIANGVKERQEFLKLSEEDSKNYTILAALYTKSRLSGEAKDQIDSCSIKNRMNYTPHYRIRLILTDKKTGFELLDFNHITSNETEIYNLIQKLKKRVDAILWNQLD